MLSVVLGLATVGAALWGLVRWWAEFLLVMKGFLPACFLVGGIVAVIAGASVLGAKPPAGDEEK